MSHLYNCPTIINNIEEHTRALQICACGIYRMWFVSDSENNLLNREVPDLSHLLITNSGEEECPICREKGTDMKTTCWHHFDRMV